MKPKIKIKLVGDNAFYWIDANQFTRITRIPLSDEKPVGLAYNINGELRLTGAGRLFTLRNSSQKVMQEIIAAVNATVGL
ncbi:MAG: hypothetical protein QY309_04700 [Cyclobacteriaceae bacterium]|nr:MAG: hypothetical protein QY309_04700 [Cyclobacteriaceae bacterium]